MLLSILCVSCSSPPKFDLTFVDEYLEVWDRFAQGDNSLIPRLENDRAKFESELAQAIEHNDLRAPGRFVFYAVIQVGGFIPVDAPLGQAFRRRYGDAVPLFVNEKDGSESYFAGDLYYWWESHMAEFERFPLYDDWRNRDFAQTVAIPMYKGASKHDR